MHVKFPTSSNDTGLISKWPLGRIILLPPDPMAKPSFRHVYLGRGAASGLQAIVTFPPSAA